MTIIGIKWTIHIQYVIKDKTQNEYKEIVL